MTLLALRRSLYPVARLATAGVLAVGLALALVPPAQAVPDARPTIRHHRPSSCRSLALSRSRPQGAAGSSYWTIRLRNTGGSTCRLRGFPRLVYLNAGHRRVGVRAGHLPMAVHTVRLRAGRVAVVVLQVPDPGNFPPRRCRPTNAAALRLTAAGRRYRVPFLQRVCTTRAGRAYESPYRLHRTH